jgi:two-component system, LuxR family, sensor kinase FixL
VKETHDRKLAEQASPEVRTELRRALEFNQSVMANMGEGLYTVDTQGLLTFINPAAERLFGWSSAELLGRKMHDMTHYEHPNGAPFPASECSGLQVLQRGLLLSNHEDVFIRKDKTFFPVIYSAAPIRSGGAITGVVVVFRDVSAQKDAEAENRRRANWLERLVETTQDAVVSIDRQARIVLFNQGAERIFGYTQVEVQGQKVNVLMAEPYAAEHDSYLERYERTGEARAIGSIRTVEARRKNGETFPIELSITKVATLESEEVHYAAFIRDISEVRRGRAWLQSLIEATQDAVLSIDRQGRVVIFNPAAERIFGYSRNEIVGQRVNVLMAEPYATEHDGYIERYEKTGEARAIGRIRSVTARRKNGELFPIELSVTKVAEDQDVQYAAFIRDISEKVKLQQQAVESERLATIGTMAAKFGHELGNPLNGMSLTIQLLEQRLRKQAAPLDEQVASTLARLKSETFRLNTLLQDFRSLSRKENYRLQPVSVTALVGEAIEIELPRYVEQGVEVESSFTTDLPPITVDIDKMKQVILNLAKNAIEAMPHGGRLSFKAAASNGAVILDISDTGVGIPQGVDIFQPFFTTKSFGTGIGMTIVRHIITAHGGSLSYRSEPGKGTTFSIKLPIG